MIDEDHWNHQFSQLLRITAHVLADSPKRVYSISLNREKAEIAGPGTGCLLLTRKHYRASSELSWIANFIWGIADDVLRDLYVRGKYRDVILPMTVLAPARCGARADQDRPCST